MSRTLIPFLLIVIAGMLFFYFTQPLMDEIAVLSDQATSLQGILSSASELASVRDGLLKSYNLISEEDKARLNKALPDQVDNVRLIIDVDTIAGKYGMKLANAQVSTENTATKNVIASADGKNYSVVTLTFETKGTYERLKLFLADLEKSLRIVDVNTLTLTAREDGVNDYTIELRTYWYRS